VGNASGQGDHRGRPGRRLTYPRRCGQRGTDVPYRPRCIRDDVNVEPSRGDGSAARSGGDVADLAGDHGDVMELLAARGQAVAVAAVRLDLDRAAADQPADQAREAAGVFILAEEV